MQYRTRYGRINIDHFYRGKERDRLHAATAKWVSMKMSFWPDPGMVNDAEFGFIQIVTCTKNGGQIYKSGNPRYDVTVGNWWLDSMLESLPLFGHRLSGGVEYRKGNEFPKIADMRQRGGNQGGFCDGMKKQQAILVDEPSREAASEAFTHKFEAAIIVTRGVRVGRCLGVIKWGYSWQPQRSILTLRNPKFRERPSNNWINVVQRWNETRNTVSVPLHLV